MIQYEEEICEHLRLPSIPKKEWDGKMPFKNGVAIVTMTTGEQAYAVVTYDKEKDEKPRVVKAFAQGIFTDIEKIFVVPEYMDVEDLDNADLDEDSKKRAKELAQEAKEIEDEGADDGIEVPKNEYFFDHIHSDEQARAYIEAYNRTNRIKGKIPRNHEGLVMRLSVIYSETNKK